MSVHSGANIVHPATEYTILSKSCIPEYAIVYSENVVYSVESSCILENTWSPIARFTRFHFVYSVTKIVYTEYAKILKQNTLFSEALGPALAPGAKTLPGAGNPSNPNNEATLRNLPL